MIVRSIGKYRVVDRVGRGGMGTVYRAIDDTLQRDVAIKVLNSELTDAEALKRFRAEAITLARLQHPSIAMLFELHEENGDLMMVMEFVRGETLQKLAERMGPMPPDFAAQLCAQALDGLAHAHRAGIIHRDLKPGNIMVTEDGLVKVMDFGIARISGSEHLTGDGLTMGTPAYMAPEQVLGQEVDARSDVYAMGVVLYRLWTGQVPFNGDTPFAIAHKQLSEPPTPLSVARPHMPSWCDTILARAMAKKPADRFQTAQEFKTALAASATFMSLDDLATATMATPQALDTRSLRDTALGVRPSIMPASGAGHLARSLDSSERRLSTPVERPATAAGTEPSGRTLVISVRHMFAGVSALVFVLVILVIAGFIVTRRLLVETASRASATDTVSPASVSAASPSVTPRPPEPAAPHEAPAVSGAVKGTSTPPVEGASLTGAVPAPPTAAALPTLTFDKLKLIVTEGDKTREQDVALQFSDRRIIIYDPAKRVVASMPYGAVRRLSSSRSRQPRWRGPDGQVAEAKISAGALGFMKSDRNWLGIATQKAAYVFRVDDDRLRSFSDTATRRTGVPIVLLAK
ncbi:MAG TPA: serine/threonine-protein kinase [Vicinamibacterales bacterium]|nr:serine/threonine-protein kinase [Vicinamibacterales bacterium]